MTRSVPEWIGASPDAVIPPRVKLRVFEQHGGKCALCGRKLGVAGQDPEFDHIIALINGGENREANIQPLCRNCHKPKTRQDVAQKVKDARVRKKHLGLHKAKHTLPGGRNDRFKAKIGGGWINRETGEPL